jgi:2-polyprenyl-3-methyl-5-hydroxy-6-metoxy-1,4-benzoquinol methylase
MGDAAWRTRAFTRQNQLAWDQVAAIRQQRFPPASFWRHGGHTLRDEDVAALGPVRGRRVLHLLCATGEDSLNLAALGARVTGVDISGDSIRIATEKAAAAGIDVEFVASDVYELPAGLRQGQFDLVFMADGALHWLPDLAEFAGIVDEAVRPDGALFVSDVHPMMATMAPGAAGLRVQDYFSSHEPQRHPGVGSLSAGLAAPEPTVDFRWPVADVVMAFVRAGWRLELLEETPAPWEWLRHRYRDLAGEARGLPGWLRLRMRRRAG